MYTSTAAKKISSVQNSVKSAKQTRDLEFGENEDLKLDLDLLAGTFDSLETA